MSNLPKVMTEDQYDSYEEAIAKTAALYEILASFVGDASEVWRLMISLPAYFCKCNDVPFEKYVADCHEHLQDMEEQLEEIKENLGN